MTWTPITAEQIEFGQQVALWIRTARESGYSSWGGEWWPSHADFVKSALLERIRSGKEPLPEPPPRGMACPWYAVVEDVGPHYVFGVHIGIPEFMRREGDTNEYVVVLQSPYIITERRGEKDFIVRDGHHKETSYRFRLWFDADWQHPSGHYGKGGWFMQNVALIENRNI